MAALVLGGGNRELFLALNRLSLSTGDTLWADITVLGDALVMLALLLPFVRRHPELVWAALLGGLLATLWTHGFKNLLGVSRPPAVLPPEVIHVIGKSHHHKSFPSGHTTTAVLFAAIVGLYWRRLGVAVPLLLAALLVGTSRIVVGVHWPLDVLAGVFGGWLSAAGGLWWGRRWRWGVTLAGQRILGLFLAVCSVALLFHDSGYPQARPLQIAIALGCLVAGIPALWRLFRPRGPIG